MQADAEHQQDDADFGQLAGETGVGDEAGRKRPEHHAGQQVADDGRDAQPVGDGGEDERQHNAANDCGDERRALFHVVRLTVLVVVGSLDCFATLAMTDVAAAQKRMFPQGGGGFG